MNSTTKKCPLCAEEIPLAAATCEYCGAQFEVTSIGYCQTCHDVREADENGHCKVCGNAVADLRVENRLIEEPVREPLPASQPIAQSEITRFGKSRLPIGILAGVLILAVVGAFLWFGRNRLFATLAPTATIAFTPSPTLTSTPTITPTRTPRLTATITPIPAWVTDFSQPILAAIANRPPDFQDDFSRASKGWQLRAGEVEISNGVLVFTTDHDGVFTSVPVPGMGFYNFVLDVDINISGLRGENTAEIKWSHYYVLEIKHDRRWFISSWQNNVRHDLGNGQQLIPDTKSVTIRLISNGAKYALYINGIPVSYGKYSEEKVGTRIEFRGWSDGTTTAIAKYDNVKVWDLDKIPNLP